MWLFLDLLVFGKSHTKTNINSWIYNSHTNIVTRIHASIASRQASPSQSTWLATNLQSHLLLYIAHYVHIHSTLDIHVVDQCVMWQVEVRTWVYTAVHSEVDLRDMFLVEIVGVLLSPNDSANGYFITVNLYEKLTVSIQSSHNWGTVYYVSHT